MKWALIGASDIAATQVLPALRQLGHEPVVVVGSDGERTARYATRNGVGYGTTSIEEALSAGVDAVYVSTTNERHAAGVGIHHRGLPASQAEFVRLVRLVGNPKAGHLLLWIGGQHAGHERLDRKRSAAGLDERRGGVERAVDLVFEDERAAGHRDDDEQEGRDEPDPLVNDQQPPAH